MDGFQIMIYFTQKEYRNIKMITKRDKILICVSNLINSPFIYRKI